MVPARLPAPGPGHSMAARRSGGRAVEEQAA